MHELTSSFVLGYHGCDRTVGEDLLRNRPFERSENDYDWLGSGVYFWESNPARALDWVRHLQKLRGGSPRSIVDPYVVGAVLDLGYCLDLISTAGVESVKASYLDLKNDAQNSGVKMPVNQGGNRGVFLEGKPVYETSGFYEKTHIQICVRALSNIKGVFRVPADQLETI